MGSGRALVPVAGQAIRTQGIHCNEDDVPGARARGRGLDGGVAPDGVGVSFEGGRAQYELDLPARQGAETHTAPLPDPATRLCLGIVRPERGLLPVDHRENLKSRRIARLGLTGKARRELQARLFGNTDAESKLRAWRRVEPIAVGVVVIPRTMCFAHIAEGRKLSELFNPQVGVRATGLRASLE